MWKLFCYDDGSTVNLWEKWYKAKKTSDDVRGKHDTKWDFLEVNEQSEWATKGTKPVRNYVEIRLSGQVAWRIMGFFGPGEHEFTVVLVCSHKQRRYTPQDALDTAEKRTKQVKADYSRRKPCARPK